MRPLPPSPMLLDVPLAELRASRLQPVEPGVWTPLAWDEVAVDTHGGLHRSDPASWAVPKTGLYQCTLTPLRIAYRRPFLLQVGVIVNGAVAEDTITLHALDNPARWERPDDGADLGDLPTVHTEVLHTALLGTVGNPLPGGTRCSLAVHVSHNSGGILTLGQDGGIGWTVLWLSV